MTLVKHILEKLEGQNTGVPHFPQSVGDIGKGKHLKVGQHANTTNPHEQHYKLPIKTHHPESPKTDDKSTTSTALLIEDEKPFQRELEHQKHGALEREEKV